MARALSFILFVLGISIAEVALCQDVDNLLYFDGPGFNKNPHTVNHGVFQFEHIYDVRGNGITGQVQAGASGRIMNNFRYGLTDNLEFNLSNIDVNRFKAIYPYRLNTSTVGFRYHLFDEDHGIPALTILANGKMLSFFEIEGNLPFKDNSDIGNLGLLLNYNLARMTLRSSIHYAFNDLGNKINYSLMFASYVEPKTIMYYLEIAVSSDFVGYNLFVTYGVMYAISKNLLISLGGIYESQPTIDIYGGNLSLTWNLGGGSNEQLETQNQ